MKHFLTLTPIFLNIILAKVINMELQPLGTSESCDDIIDENTPLKGIPKSDADDITGGDTISDDIANRKVCDENTPLNEHVGTDEPEEEPKDPKV